MARSGVCLLLVLGAGCGEPSETAASTTSGGGAGDGGVPAGCAPGELLDDAGDCAPAGVPPEACGEGFTADGAARCRPPLPPEPCPARQRAVPGEPPSHPVAPCAPGAWGDVPVDADTLFVDPGYVGPSDGSAGQPWTTIQAALDAAGPGALIALADGDYAEPVLVVGRPVRIWGRCPELVRIAGLPGEFAAVLVGQGADGTELRSLSILGATMGFAASGSADLLLDHVWIHDTSDWGIDVQEDYGPVSITVRASLVEGTRGIGAYVRGSSATIESSVVRDVEATGANDGAAIAVLDASDGSRSQVEVRGSLVERAQRTGVTCLGSDLALERTVVRDTLTGAQGLLGRGVDARDSDASGAPSTVAISGCVIERNVESGIVAFGSEVSIEASVVRDTEAETNGKFGRGIAIEPGAMQQRSSVVIRSSLVERSRDDAVIVSASDLVLERTILRDTLEQPLDGRFGRGVSAQGGAVVALRGCVVERSRELGVLVSRSTLTAESTRISDTQPRASDGAFGDGVAVVGAFGVGAATLSGCLVERSARAGLAAFGASVELGATALRCNAIHLDGEPSDGTRAAADFAFHDGGGNTCGCDGQEIACALVTSGLAPPEPL